MLRFIKFWKLNWVLFCFKGFISMVFVYMLHMHLHFWVLMHFQLQTVSGCYPTALPKQMHIQVLEEWVGIEKAYQNSFWLLNLAVSLLTRKTEEASFPDRQALNLQHCAGQNEAAYQKRLDVSFVHQWWQKKRVREWSGDCNGGFMTKKYK